MQPLDRYWDKQLVQGQASDVVFERAIRAFAVKDVVLTSLAETDGLVWEGEITPALLRELSENLVADTIERYIYFENEAERL